MSRYTAVDFVPLWIDPIKNKARRLFRATKEIRRIVKELERQLDFCYEVIGLHPTIETFSGDEWEPGVHISTTCSVCGVKFCPITWVESRVEDTSIKYRTTYFETFGRMPTDIMALGRFQTLPTYEVRRYRRSDTEEDMYFPACSEECVVRLQRLLISIELRRQLEWETIKTGKKLLKEAKHYLQGKNRELSSLPKRELKQGPTLPIL